MKRSESATRQPVLFVGHGSPMNALEDNRWSRAFRSLATELPRPRAVLCVSAHWFVSGTQVTLGERPETIHDFGNFPKALHEMQYPAPGSPDLATRILGLLDGARGSSDWGLDHGTWSVLVHLLPEADVPVLQLSIDSRLAPERHVELGRALQPLRSEGVLILASGNVTHNLRHAFASLRSGDDKTPDWARDFDRDVSLALERRDEAFLARALETDSGRLSHPTPEHYLPLLYALGASLEDEAVQFPIAGFDAGSLSMRAARFG